MGYNHKIAFAMLLGGDNTEGVQLIVLEQCFHGIFQILMLFVSFHAKNECEVSGINGLLLLIIKWMEEAKYQNIYGCFMRSKDNNNFANVRSN